MATITKYNHKLHKMSNKKVVNMNIASSAGDGNKINTITLRFEDLYITLDEHEINLIRLRTGR